jgi:hypothetical protein
VLLEDKNGNGVSERLLNVVVSGNFGTSAVRCQAYPLCLRRFFLVIKLFNAILQASATHATDAATLALDDTNKRKSKKEKDNVLGRGGKEDRLTKEGFLDLIKSGGK